MDAELVAEPLVSSAPPQLSGLRTFLFAALACSWFTEMVFLGFASFSKVWTHLWQVTPPSDPQLLTALSITWAVAAPAKGALCVMAVLGFRSKIPRVRTALFASMALVPPLNLAFPFRQQGFLAQPVAVATTLTVILWGSFFLFREPAPRPEPGAVGDRAPAPSSRAEIARRVWFAVYAAVLTVLAILFMLWPGTALRLMLPGLARLARAQDAELPGLIHSGMASGTHLLALATACWIATARFRSSPELRTAMAVACAVHAGLFVVFPLRQILAAFGARSATSSILIVFVPLFVGWIAYAAGAGPVSRPAEGER